jgi:hypothetical protein
MYRAHSSSLSTISSYLLRISMLCCSPRRSPCIVITRAAVLPTATTSKALLCEISNLRCDITEALALLCYYKIRRFGRMQWSNF